VSKRTLVPVVLLIAAACSLAAVFGVQRIESRRATFGEPYAARFFSPNGDGRQDKAEVRFTMAHSGRVTIRIRDAKGDVVRTLPTFRASGGEQLDWDGRDDVGDVVADGTYDVRLTRAGERREYAPTEPVRVETTPPVAVIDRATIREGAFIGLAALEEGATLVFEDTDGEVLENVRVWRPAPGTESGTFERTPPRGTIPVRFKAPLAIDPDDLRIYAEDRSGNRKQLPVMFRTSVVLASRGTT